MTGHKKFDHGHDQLNLNYGVEPKSWQSPKKGGFFNYCGTNLDSILQKVPAGNVIFSICTNEDLADLSN